jgi:hypothetical protein
VVDAVRGVDADIRGDGEEEVDALSSTLALLL